MRDIEITGREILVSVVIVLLMISLGFLISTNIHDKVSTGNEKYFKAVKINNNPDLFNHAISTDVGGIISFGTFKANDPISDPLIDGEYFSMIKAEEHYVMKTRTVTYTDSDGKTQTRTETYWEWDEVKRERFNTNTFNYLGRDFDYETIKFNHHSYTDTIKKGFGSKVRWKFHTIPKAFEGSLYSRAGSRTINKNEIYPGQNIEGLVSQKEKDADSAVIGFWIFWSVLIVITVSLFVALDNRIINNQI